MVSALVERGKRLIVVYVVLQLIFGGTAIVSVVVGLSSSIAVSGVVLLLAWTWLGMRLAWKTGQEAGRVGDDDSGT